MSPTITPFQSQLSQFDQFAQQGFPLSQFLTTSAPQQGTAGGSAAPQSTSNCAWYDFTCKFLNALGIQKGASTLSWTRIAAFLLGLIAIAGAIYLFKPTQEIVKGALAA